MAALAQWTPEVEAALRRDVREPRSLLEQMAWYHMGWIDADGRAARAGGKHVRSNLCCWAAAACGAEPSSALPAACAIELAHNFTLVHDDVQDGDRTRRGRPTVWSIWGTDQAINAGDYLFARACRIMLGGSSAAERARRMDAAEIVVDAIVEVIDGQTLDLEHECRPEIGIAGYLQMVEAKTGALLGASLEAGAAMAGAAEPTRAALRVAGRRLGVAFQLRDDWLGVWGDAAVTGKSQATDLIRRKLGYPIAAAYEAGSAGQRRRLRELYRTRGAEGEPEIRHMLELLGIADLTAEAATRHAQEAVAEVHRAELDQVRREEFAGVAQYVAERNR